MTEEQFMKLWVECSSNVADHFYPKGRRIRRGLTLRHDPRRGEYLRDQGVLHAMVLEELREAEVIDDRQSPDPEG